MMSGMMHAGRKYLRVGFGFLVLVLGVILAIPLVPGPGIPLIVFGLVLLSDHFEWARRYLAWMREKWSGLKDRVEKRFENRQRTHE